MTSVRENTFLENTMPTNRRTFLASSLTLAAGAACSQPLLSNRLFAGQPAKYTAITSFEETAAKIKPYLQCGDEATMKFAVTTYRDCLLSKIVPAEFQYRYAHVPGGGNYGHFEGLWDNMFVIDALSVLPEYRELAYGIVQNMFDFQTWWDAHMPDYRRGMLSNQTRPDPAGWEKSLRYSQFPLVGWGLDRVYRRTGNIGPLKPFLKPLENFHEWYWRERDVTDVGLVGVGSYTGDVQQARFETFDFECNLDDLKLTRHPRRNHKDVKEGIWYGDILLPATTTYLLQGEQCLARLAELAGDSAMAERRRKRLDRGTAAMREHMWDEPSGAFLAVHRDTLKKIRIPTIGSWVPLITDVPTKEMAAKMAETLATPDWMTPLPVPTVARSDPRWESGGVRFWRGDVWPATNYQVAYGLARFGHRELAARIVDLSVANAMNVGLSERYDSVSGRALGVVGLGMSCTLLLMLLDGLSEKYAAKVVTSTA
jgi:hypothetical protein